MRLHQWPKDSPLIKRCTVANEACDNTRATVTGRPAKDKMGDKFDPRILCADVLQVADNVCKDDMVGMYRDV